MWTLVAAPRGCGDSYLVESPETHEVTDFCSFYTLPSSVLNNANYATLKAAYSYYNVSTKTPLQQLMNDALIVAKRNNYDVFNALDVMENESFLKELKFGPGDGQLHYTSTITVFAMASSPLSLVLCCYRAV
ncbi:Glycylpeptide N-tetradecanoyltransferase 1 [Zea mays]|uniref:Glycylpeptide N-tetradecanoyltransferase n=1 Tax=Zea mays TaxID=4577 RepID=A0A1D6G322_MAIZE|nr:Glycylpeptide N-tetradecanoyltransferase 1 [Zea mays]